MDFTPEVHGGDKVEFCFSCLFQKMWRIPLPWEALVHTVREDATAGPGAVELKPTIVQVGRTSGMRMRW